MNASLLALSEAWILREGVGGNVPQKKDLISRDGAGQEQALHIKERFL
jgi:hypothetical protein